MKNTMKPRLRFSEFDELISHLKLNELVKFKSGGTPPISNKSYWGGPLPWISASSMIGKYYISSDRTITEIGLKNGSKLAKKGSLLILVRGSMLYNKVPVGIAGKDVAFNQDLKALIPNDRINNEFLYQWFSAKQHFLLNKVSGTGIGAGKLDTDQLKSLKLFVPSKEEQQKIADFFSSIDHKIQQLRRKKELMEEYKKGVMQKLFSQEIRFKDENGKNFADWESKRLEEILDINYGKDYKDLGEGDIPLIGTGGIMGYVDDFLYNKPSVLIGRKGTIDKPQYIEEPFWTVDTLFYTKVSESVDPYFAYLLVSRINLLKYNEASGVPSLSVRSLNSIKVKLPNSFKEQLRIAKFVKNIDEKISHIKGKIELTQTFKKGLLQQMFV
ncbi:restriction endonuclease subunit S [Gracilimonas sediminicola]|uniref:restriction endonuclease subunit S n=1 Tax=Gracilimonas sediminicola TaxID=2952158 RepID=UPI0038D4F579